MNKSPSKLSRYLWNLLKVSVSCGGLAYIFMNIPFHEVSQHWTHEALPWILVTLVTTFLSMCIQANRWRGLLLDEGKKIKFRSFYAYIALGYFFNNLLPGGFGGDAVKTVAFGKRFGNMAAHIHRRRLSICACLHRYNRRWTFPRQDQVTTRNCTAIPLP